jgi:hypothetical protein
MSRDETDPLWPASPRPEKTPDSWSTLRLLRLWFGLREEVGPKAYAISGFGLTAFKYAVEAGAIAFLSGRFYSPIDFLSPILIYRTSYLTFLPVWVAWLQLVIAIVFVWIAVSMSVRRAVNAGSSAFWGLLVLVPFVNYLVMLILCVLPTSPNRGRMEVAADVPGENPSPFWAAARGALLSLVPGGLLFALSVYGLNNYGAALFVGTPLLMGVLAGYFFNRPRPNGVFASMAVGLLSTMLALSVLMLFAFEGAICLMMAAPLVLPLGAIGGALGKVLASVQGSPSRQSWIGVLALPLFAFVEPFAVQHEERSVLTAVEIDAPPAVVWHSVVEFSELPAATEWYFRAGIAAPQRAKIFGTGVGAIRNCEFTTGTFVEPITVWDEPRRLAFDVTEQPEPMFELTPYQSVHPPHLSHSFRSEKGEFRLIELPGGRTRLEGRTWYQLDMRPQDYWTPWAHWLIHRIHDRVLLHIKRLAEAPDAATTVLSRGTRGS